MPQSVTYLTPIGREIPTALKNDAVKSTTTYDVKGVQTSTPLEAIAGFKLRFGDNFSSDYYDFTWRLTAQGYRWVRNAKSGYSTTGGPGGNYAPLDSPTFINNVYLPDIANVGDTTDLNMSRAVNLRILNQVLKTMIGGTGAVMYVAGSIPRSFATTQDAINALPDDGTNNGTFKYGIIWMMSTDTTEVLVNKNCTLEAVAPCGPLRFTNPNRCLLRGNLRNTTPTVYAYVQGGNVEIRANIYYYNGNGAPLIAYPSGTMEVVGDLIMDTTSSDAKGYNSDNASSATNRIYFRMTGNVLVLKKGSPFLMKNDFTFFGSIVSNDLPPVASSGRHHLYATTIDLRGSSNANPSALWLGRSNGYPDAQNTTLYSGSLLVKAGVPAIYNSNAVLGQAFQLSRSVTTNATVANDASIAATYIDSFTNF